ncbi:conjugal transfer protein TraX [Intestinibacillus massiliensis]|nr:conjugal transfer protein TraX [Intestinibacillus massiliensis]
MNFKQLKCLAIGCMAFDHVTRIFPIDYMLFPLADALWAAGHPRLADGILQWVPFLLGFIGRLAAPVFLFCIVNGFFHTHSVRKYLLRLTVAAVIAQPPYMWFDIAEQKLYGVPRPWQPVGLNILFTLAFGLAAIAAFDCCGRRNRHFTGLLVVLAAAAACHYLPCEGKEGYILLIFTFYLLRGRPRRVQAALLAPAVALSRIRLILMPFTDPAANWASWAMTASMNVAGNYFGTLIPLLYNGEKGEVKPWFQWSLYAFYPAHFALLAAIGWLRPPF